MGAAVRISRYGTGLVLLHPALPHHRLNRVPTHQLIPTTDTMAEEATR